ncbi:MAG TPA: DUF4345 domain-containing protein [Gemmatimonadales bacterium]
MTAAKGLLLLGAFVLAAIGVGFLIAPVQWAAIVEIALPTPTARTDLRATYGGFDLGFGVFLAVCAFRPAWIRPGLAALGLAAAGFAGGRLLGILAEGTASPPMIGFAALEVAIAAGAFVLLRRLPHP